MAVIIKKRPKPSGRILFRPNVITKVILPEEEVKDLDAAFQKMEEEARLNKLERENAEAYAESIAAQFEEPKTFRKKRTKHGKTAAKAGVEKLHKSADARRLFEKAFKGQIANDIAETFIKLYYQELLREGKGTSNGRSVVKIGKEVVPFLKTFVGKLNLPTEDYREVINSIEIFKGS